MANRVHIVTSESLGEREIIRGLYSVHDHACDLLDEGRGSGAADCPATMISGFARGSDFIQIDCNHWSNSCFQERSS